MGGGGLRKVRRPNRLMEGLVSWGDHILWSTPHWSPSTEKPVALQHAHEIAEGDHLEIWSTDTSVGSWHSTLFLLFIQIPGGGRSVQVMFRNSEEMYEGFNQGELNPDKFYRWEQMLNYCCE